jgi:hypothetical protein
MSDIPNKIIADISTGITTQIPLTPQELEELEANAIQAATEQAERDAQAQVKADLKASAKAKLIAGQPLTAEEADTLVI